MLDPDVTLGSLHTLEALDHLASGPMTLCSQRLVERGLKNERAKISWPNTTLNGTKTPGHTPSGFARWTHPPPCAALAATTCAHPTTSSETVVSITSRGLATKSSPTAELYPLNPFSPHPPSWLTSSCASSATLVLQCILLRLATGRTFLWNLTRESVLGTQVRPSLPLSHTLFGRVCCLPLL
jgi:hypothetical protein